MSPITVSVLHYRFNGRDSLLTILKHIFRVLYGVYDIIMAYFCLGPPPLFTEKWALYVQFVYYTPFLPERCKRFSLVPHPMRGGLVS